MEAALEGSRGANSEGRNSISSDDSESFGPGSHATYDTGSRPASSSVRCQQYSARVTNNTGRWLEATSPTPASSDEGLIGELVELIGLFFDGILFAVRIHQDADSVREMHEVRVVLENRHRFKIWRTGNDKLDRKLALEPQIRRRLVLDLTALALALSQGMELYDPQLRETLREMTSCAVDQASILTRFRPRKSLECLSPPNDIIDFLRGIHREIQTRLDLLLEQTTNLGPTLVYVEGRDSGCAQGLRHGDHGLRASENIMTRPQAPNEETCQILPAHLESDLKSANLSSSRTVSSRIPCVFSETEDNSYHPLTDTDTSASSSQAHDGHGVPAKLKELYRNIGEAARSFQKYGKFHIRYRSSSASSVGQLEVMDSVQRVHIWNQNRSGSRKYRVKLDSASSGDFIASWVVDTHGLVIESCPDGEEEYQMCNNKVVHVNGCVRPDWQFVIGRTRRQNTDFFVLGDIPSGFAMVIGEATMTQMGICLHANKTLLVAFKNPREEKGCDGRSQSQHIRQTLDGSRSQDQRRQTLDKNDADAERSYWLRKSQNPQLREEVPRQNGSRQKKSQDQA